jgi:molybdopterin-containing oxidoreductase family membrane subunit
MDDERFVIGVYERQDDAAAAVEAIKSSPFRLRRVNMPFPGRKILDAMKLRKSRAGYFTLAGGIFGFFSGILLAAFTAQRWELIVSGKPVLALIPFLIVGFEFTILFAVFGNLLGFLLLAGMPRFEGPEHYDPRFSGSHFGILASCSPGDEDDLKRLIEERGGEARICQS